jgi:hypothetical protein
MEMQDVNLVRLSVQRHVWCGEGVTSSIVARRCYTIVYVVLSMAVVHACGGIVRACLLIKRPGDAQAHQLLAGQGQHQADIWSAYDLCM